MAKKTPQTTQEHLRSVVRKLPPPSWTPAGQRVQKAAEEFFDSNPEEAARVKEMHARVVRMLRLVQTNGSGMAASRLFRKYHYEFVDRLLTKGFYSLPTSLNVMAGFLPFHDSLFTFDIWPEVESAVHAADFFPWFSDETGLGDMAALSDIMEEDCIYSFNFTDSPADYSISALDAAPAEHYIVLSCSMVRHKGELSLVAEFGEKPSLYEHAPEIDWDDFPGTQSAGHEGIKPDSDLTAVDGMIEGHDGYGRVLLFTSIDLHRGVFQNKYAYTDMGPSLSLATDDPNVFDASVSREHVNKTLEHAGHRLAELEPIFATLLSMAFLPVYRIAMAARTRSMKLPTEQFEERRKKFIKSCQKDKVLAPQVKLHRDLAWIPPRKGCSVEAETTVNPPSLEQEVSGTWKVLPPNQIGRDKKDEPCAGRTWETKTTAWTAEPLGAFLFREHPAPMVGNDPGFIYLMHSKSHGPGTFKIGLTRRSSEERAKELSTATANPSPMVVLQDWRAGDCVEAEKQIHKRLAHLRVNPKREFFQGSLHEISSVIEEVIGAQRS